MTQGSPTGINGWLYVPNELASHIPYQFFVRLKNFEFTPLNRITSRRGLEPVRYYNLDNELPQVDNSLALIKVDGTAEDNIDQFMAGIQTSTLNNFGDSLIFSGPNSASFYILPFSLRPNGESKLYEYLAEDINDNRVTGDERGGFHIYNGIPVFWNGFGTYQVFARTINKSGFTRLDNDVLPLEDQTIIGATTFENRLVVVTLQGFLMWSQPDWDGVSVWQDSVGNATNWVQLSTDPGEIIEFVRGFRGGLIISTRTSANVSGRIINVSTLDPTGITVTDTGVDSFFTRNAVISSTDNLVGISPQGVINVSFDSLAQSAKAEFNTSAPIIEYLSEVFEDNNVTTYLDAHLDTKNRKGYFIHDWSTNGERTSKILVFDYSSENWSLLETRLPAQRAFQMYDTLCVAGFVRAGSDLFLGIWSFSEYPQDVSYTISSNTRADSEVVYYRDVETDVPIEKSFITGVLNTAKVGPNEVPGSGQSPIQLLFSTLDPAEYKLGFRSFSSQAWGGGLDDIRVINMTEVEDLEQYSIGDYNSNNAKWNQAYKLHACYQRWKSPIPNPNLYYQVLFYSNSPTFFSLHSMLRDNNRMM